MRDMRDLIDPCKDIVDLDELYQAKFVASMNNCDLLLQDIITLQKIAMSKIACNIVFSPALQALGLISEVN